MTGACPVRDRILVEMYASNPEFPVREIMSVENRPEVLQLSVRTSTSLNPVNALRASRRIGAYVSIDAISLTGNLIKPNVSSTNIKSLTELLRLISTRPLVDHRRAPSSTVDAPPRRPSTQARYQRLSGNGMIPCSLCHVIGRRNNKAIRLKSTFRIASLRYQ
jgi:hypothetical protein